MRDVDDVQEGRITDNQGEKKRGKGTVKSVGSNPPRLEGVFEVKKKAKRTQH